MKLVKSLLDKIIKEEFDKFLEERDPWMGGVGLDGTEHFQGPDAEDAEEWNYGGGAQRSADSYAYAMNRKKKLAQLEDDYADREELDNYHKKALKNVKNEMKNEGHEIHHINSIIKRIKDQWYREQVDLEFLNMRAEEELAKVIGNTVTMSHACTPKESPKCQHKMRRNAGMYEENATPALRQAVRRSWIDRTKDKIDRIVDKYYDL
tara:strand:+ start:1410 stop:2030 length:621 start_codon:yes stop_codon:yes gene_type:complete